MCVSASVVVGNHEWETGREEEVHQQRRRRGRGGLRIFCQRPWSKSKLLYKNVTEKSDGNDDGATGRKIGEWTGGDGGGWWR